MKLDVTIDYPCDVMRGPIVKEIVVFVFLL